MMKSSEPRNVKPIWHRILAFTLAVSLLLIPVEFPGAAKAVNPDRIYPTYIADDFNDAKYASGVTFKWSMDFTGGSVKEGSLQLNTSESAKNSCYTYLTATTQDPNPPFKTADLTKSWTDYTVEMDFKRTGAPQSSTGVFLIGRNDGTTRYSMQSNGNKIALRRWDGGKYTLLTSADFPTDAESWYHMKMEFKGNTIICSAANADGTEKASFTFTDSSVLAPKYGSVGMHVSKLAGWCPQFDNYKVTAADGTLLFFDDFTDSRYLDGVTTKWDAFSSETVTAYKWNEDYSDATSSSFNEDGQYVVSVGKTGTEKLFLNGEISNSAMANQAYDIADVWSNYTVEFDYNADYTVYIDDGGTERHPGIFVHGRAQYDAEHDGYSSYAIKLHPGVGAYYFKYYYDTVENEWTYTYGQFTAAKPFKDAFANGAMLHAKVSFEDVAGGGVKITVTLTDENGNIVSGINGLSWTDAGEKHGAALRTGGVYLSMEPTNSKSTADNWTATYDNFKVTLDNEVTFEDTFADERYFLGATNEEEVEVQYAWTEKDTATTSSITNGQYVVSVGKTVAEELFLNGVISNPAAPNEEVDIADVWTDYTVEFDYNANYNHTLKNNNNAEWHPVVSIHGRAQYDEASGKYSSYAVKLHPNVGVYFFKYYFDTENRWTSTNKSYAANFKEYFANGEMLHAKVSFEDVANGVKISVTLTDEDGKSVKEISWTDTGENGAILSNGGVYLSMDKNHSGDTVDTWTATFDDFKVTMDNRVVFKDTFTLAENQSTADYLAAGKTGKMVMPDLSTGDGNSNEEESELQYNWKESYNTNATSSAISDGRYVVTVGNKEYEELYLTGEVLNPLESNEALDIADIWDDYTVEFDYNADYNVYVDGNNKEKHPGIFVHGRAQYDAVNGGYTSYAVKLHPGVGVYFFKYYYDTTQNKWKNYTPVQHTTAKAFKDAFADGAMLHIKVSFENVAEGVKITVTMTDEDGNPVSGINDLSWTDTGVSYGTVYRTGGVYLTMENKTSLDTEKPTWTAAFDNFKVTMDNRVVFEDTFTLADTQTAAEYLEAGKKVSLVNKTEWVMENGALTANAKSPSVNLVTAMSGQKNCALDWADYAVDANILLTSDNSAASLIANSNGTDYYEMQLTTSGVKLYKVSGDTSTLLAEKEKGFTLNEWYFTKLEVDDDGKTLKGYVNSELVVVANEPTDGALTKGTTGLKACGSVKFDDFAAYAVELSNSRPFAKYTFNASDVTELQSSWDVVDDGTWTVVNGNLTYQNSTPAAEGRMALRSKATLDNYNAEAVMILPETGKGGILGRYSANGYYKIMLDTQAGLTLYKGETELKNVSVEELYLSGIKVLPNTKINVKLYMFGNLLQGFVDGQLAISFVDEVPLTSGVSGVCGANGAAFISLTTSEAFALPASAVLSITDTEGQPLTNIQVYEGKVPDIMNMRLKVVYDGNTELIPLDFVLDYKLLDYNVPVYQTKTIPVAYNGSSINFSYTVIPRSEEIAALDTAISNLKDPAQLTLEDADEVAALVKAYNDLSFKEKSDISEANTLKLTSAKEAILTLHYAGKEVLGDVIFTDTFDTAESEKKYTSDYMVTTDADTGNWFVFNGEMLEYDSIPTIEEPGSFQPSNLLIDRDYEATSISVDFKFIQKNAWAGLRFASRNGEYFKVWVSGKDNKNRIILKKTNTVIDTVYTTDVDPGLVFDLGEWYNLRIFQADGWVRIYINDILCYQYKDTVTVAEDEFLTHGTVGMAISEGFCKFDNLEIRGKDLGYTPENGATHNTKLPETQWSDDFDDKTDDEPNEKVGSDPSHWLELSHRDDWKVKADGNNLVYGTTGCTGSESQTWLHVFETDVDYTADLRVTAKGAYASVGMMARLNADTSYIKAGYDFTLQKWFIKVRYGADFDEVTFYADEKSEFALNTFYKVRLLVKGTTIQLFVGENATKAVVTADAGKKVSPGRVGVFNICCDVDVDNVDLKQLSGQGRVNDGVMEQYTSQAGVTTPSKLFQILELKDPDGKPNGNFLMSQGTDHWISTDGGMTWKKESKYSQYEGGTTAVLHDGKILEIRDFKDVYISEDYGITWKRQGTLPWPEGWDYAQPAEHLSEVKLANGSYRIFFTVGNNSKVVTPQDSIAPRTNICDVYYSDDQGKTWTMSENSPLQFSNLQVWCESHIIKTEGVFEGNPLIMYSAYNSSDCMRYSLSYDEGKTWQGDYAMPQLACGWNTMTIEEDPYNPGTYYMATFYNIPSSIHLGLPRLRVALLKSTDGFNWEYLCDIDRWGDVSDIDKGHIMQGVNMYLTVAKDYVFVSFSRSEEYEPGNHRKQLGRLYRFEKSKMDAYDVWPQEYIIPDKAITSIEVIPGKTEITLNDSNPLAGSKIKVNYYKNDPKTGLNYVYVDLADVMDLTTNIDHPRAFTNFLDDMTTVGKKSIVVDYKHFRTIYTVNVVKGEAPVISGVADGKTYCGAQEVTVSDANDDLVSVTVNGTAVALSNGKFTISAAEGEQIIIATDKAGNFTEIVITVNADHSWSSDYTTENGQHWKECTVDGCTATTTKTNCSGGEVDCQNKAECEICGKAYGSVSSEHKWSENYTTENGQHWKTCTIDGCTATTTKTDCSGGTATCEDKAVCSVCNAEYGKLADHKGGEATCTDKAKCEVCGEAYGEKNADKHAKDAKWTIGTDKHSKAYECCGKVEVTEAAHTGGTATCEDKAVCSVCNAEYGKLADHKGGEATCTDKAKCSVCGEAYGEKNADKHAKDAKWTTTADKHSKAYECCGKVVVAEEAHEWVSGKCEECGYEAAPGTEQKPIEIPADKETVKAEAKVEAGAEQYFELDEKLAGKTITIKGEGAYVIIEGKKYEAVNGVLEVKLPAKTGKISIVIGNAGTKAGTFSITIATPSEDNSDTGDNTAIVLFGSLMALSVLTAGVLLIPNIRKKLLNK